MEQKKKLEELLEDDDLDSKTRKEIEQRLKDYPPIFDTKKKVDTPWFFIWIDDADAIM